jgi:hypothetical protein
MSAKSDFADIDPECVDREELRRGATAVEIRGQASRILRYIDQADRDVYDREQFAALFARAVGDALDGRAPCVLH